mmetsp:Transcript_15200/g.29886  ORF Transcript_15200/g.29886 Transcript_15200/m.29886 type:complete len:179 (+) Transcript_15200:431-967(+)
MQISTPIGQFGSYSGELTVEEDSEKPLPRPKDPQLPFPLASSMLLHHVLLFDGKCLLCNRSVDFIVARDQREPPLFKFAAFQSEVGAELSRLYNIPTDNLDSVVMIHSNGEVFTHSAAALKVAQNLPLPWRLVGFIGMLFPRPLRDTVYNYIGRNRYRFFGTAETCRMPSPADKQRFL